MSAAHTIRPARLEDAPALQQIYAHYVEQTAYSFEYQPPTPQEFQARIAATLQAYPYLVAEVEGTPLGYAYAGRMRSREAYDWVVETTVYLAPQAIGQGLGRALYDALLPQLASQGVQKAYACITANNTGSIDFHKHLGFVEEGYFFRGGYKMGQWWDVVWLALDLGGFPCPPPALRPWR